MSTESRQQLISAYLDGELALDERAEVEKWLAEDAQLRQFHDELLAIRSGLQSLPRHGLDHDISAAVLRRAEQSVLRGGESKPVAGKVRPGSAATSWWSRGAGWRRVVWPAIAVAAALVILVYDANRRPVEREVAVVPEQQSTELELRRETDEAAPLGGLNDGVAGEANNRAFRPQAGETESLRRKIMPQLKSAPAAPQTASETAASPSGVDTRLNSVAKQQPAAGLVFQCSPQYLRERTFERALDEKKIKWRRVDQRELLEKLAQTDRDEPAQRNDWYYSAAKDGTLTATYVVDASPKQVDQILEGLEISPRRFAGKKAEDKMRLRGRSSDVEFGFRAPAQSRAAGNAADMARGVTITLVAPQSPPPAADSPADESP